MSDTSQSEECFSYKTSKRSLLAEEWIIVFWSNIYASWRTRKGMALPRREEDIYLQVGVMVHIICWIDLSRRKYKDQEFLKPALRIKTALQSNSSARMSVPNTSSRHNISSSPSLVRNNKVDASLGRSQHSTASAGRSLHEGSSQAASRSGWASLSDNSTSSPNKSMVSIQSFWLPFVAFYFTNWSWSQLSRLWNHENPWLNIADFTSDCRREWWNSWVCWKSELYEV
jgi:hypothetical protein